MAVAGKRKIFDNKYEILSIVGRGSRSVVYHARNVSDDNGEVALKVLIENKKDTISNSEKLRREALAMVSSHHPSVVRLDDFHSVGDICYLSMEYAPEADLRKYSHKIGGIPPEQAEAYLLQVCEALEYIHRVGIIHRDIKPDNLLVVDEANIRVGDFGVALLPGDENAPQDLRNAVGTMDYMAPEVLEGLDYNQRSDIYSLGVTFYEMMSGTHPFASASLAKQLEIRRDENVKSLAELNPQIPAYLSEGIQRAMAYDPKDRFNSAKEFLQHLKQKRTQKQAVPKKEERPQLKVIPGTVPAGSPAPAMTSQEEEAVISEEDSAEPAQPAVETAQTEVPEAENSPEPTAAVEPIIVEEEPPQRPVQMQNAPDPHTPAAAARVPAAQTARSHNAPLKDSRASRTPTVFISKESAQEIREEASRPSKVASRTISHRPAPRPLPQNNSLAIGVSAIGILLTILGWNILSSHRNETAQVSKLEETEETSALPSYEGEDLSFPDLPKGVYTGSIKGLVPSGLVGMTVVSMGDSGQLALVIGLDGWSPTIVTLGENTPSAIRVVSNGFILEFSGQANKGVIQGTVKNIITGTQGAFALKPA